MPSAVLHKKCKHLSKKNEHICLPLKNNDEKLPLKNNDNSNNNDNGTCVLLAHICDQHVTVRVPFWRRLFSACSRERCKKKAEPVQGCFCRGHANYTASMCVCARALTRCCFAGVWPLWPSVLHEWDFQLSEATAGAATALWSRGRRISLSVHVARGKKKRRHY